MKGCTYRSWLFTVAVFSVILSCARQAAPSGGPKDLSPPVVLKSIPLNESLNFTGKSIVITFDEFIAFDKLNEKFMISPPMNKKPEILIKGKNIDIKFQENLKDSTTYTLYFQDAIRDLNEGNPITNYQFVFSTGNVLDSLSVTGNVFKASDLEVTENTIITMYRQLADSFPVKQLPEYITLADKNGGFRINNIKEGTYNIFALQDKNNNKKYDLAEEGFAFMDNPVEITTKKNYLPVKVVKDTIKAVVTKGIAVAKKTPEIPLIDGEYKLYVSVAPLTKHYLTSSDRKTAQHLIYTLSLPTDSIKFGFKIPDTDPRAYFIEKNLTGDTINVWLTDSSLYSKQEIKPVVGYPFTDSTGITVLKTDTITMRSITTRSIRNREALSVYKVTANIPGGTLSPGELLSFSSQTPFRKPDTARIHLFETLKSGNVAVPFRMFSDTLNSGRYYLNAKLKESSTYHFAGFPGSFGDIYGNNSDSTNLKFQVRSTTSFGKLTLNLSNVSGNVIVQLLDQMENIITWKRLSAPGKVEFPLLERGIYKARVIYDTNGDGKWTTGDFKTKRQPEAVSYFNREIEIKIDWELVEDWDISIQNRKDPKLRSKKL